MPTVIRIGHFRFHFYSDEGSESPHIHVRSSDGECKFWLEPITDRGTRRLKSIYHKLSMVLARKSSPRHLSLINNNS
ncbi:MAG: DUF4160 domain-containing protein [Microcystis aeruginosa]